jgi:hypothetical protein
MRSAHSKDAPCARRAAEAAHLTCALPQACLDRLGAAFPHRFHGPARDRLSVSIFSRHPESAGALPSRMSKRALAERTLTVCADTVQVSRRECACGCDSAIPQKRIHAIIIARVPTFLIPASGSPLIIPERKSIELGKMAPIRPRPGTSDDGSVLVTSKQTVARIRDPDPTQRRQRCAPTSANCSRERRRTFNCIPIIGDIDQSGNG